LEIKIIRISESDLFLQVLWTFLASRCRRMSSCCAANVTTTNTLLASQMPSCTSSASTRVIRLLRPPGTLFSTIPASTLFCDRKGSQTITLRHRRRFKNHCFFAVVTKWSPQILGLNRNRPDGFAQVRKESASFGRRNKLPRNVQVIPKTQLA